MQYSKTFKYNGLLSKMNIVRLFFFNRKKYFPTPWHFCGFYFLYFFHLFSLFIYLSYLSPLFMFISISSPPSIFIISCLSIFPFSHVSYLIHLHCFTLPLYLSFTPLLTSTETRKIIVFHHISFLQNI